MNFKSRFAINLCTKDEPTKQAMVNISVSKVRLIVETSMEQDPACAAVVLQFSKNIRLNNTDVAN